MTDRTMLRVGGISALLLGLAYLVITGLYSVAGAMPDGAEASLSYLAGRTTVWWGITWLSVLTDILFLPVVLALYEALKGVNRYAMLLGAGLVVLFVVLDLAVTWTNYGALITLAGDFAASTSEAQQAASIAGATYPAAVLGSNLFPVYVVLIPGLGILVMSVVMLRGRFGRATGYVGVLTGILAVVAILGPMLVSALGILVIVTAVLTTVWVFLVGYRLLRSAPS